MGRPLPFPPIEPPKPRVRFPDPSRPRAPEVLAMGCDFSPGTLLLAYRSGIFPWPHGDAREPDAYSGEGADGEPHDPEPNDDEHDARPPMVLWFSPEPRAIFPLEKPLEWSRSLRRTLRKHPYEVTMDEAFGQVMRMCGETRANNTWIIPELVAGYEELHELGWAHSVEVWERSASGRDRELVGGIYGVSIGGLFAGESMFHLRTDTSKIAFATLAEKLQRTGYSLFDVQVQNGHLESLGCIEIPRIEYLERLALALKLSPRIVRPE